MKSVVNTCTPRAGIMQGTFNPEVFTAALGPVIQYYKGQSSSIDSIYTDARAFFAEGTYPTDGLKQMVSSVFRRISGDLSAPSIIRMETAFGGGKTHGLIACVHIANRGKDIADEVKNILDEQYLPDPGSVTVVGIAGDEIPVAKTQGDRLVPYTLWGELAYQVGGQELYNEVRTEAELFASPGKDYLETVLGGKKILIMLDELAQYAARLEAAHPNGGAEQLAAFLMALDGYAKTHTGIAIVLTLAGTTDAFSKQTESLTRLLNRIGNGDLNKDDALALAERATKGVTSVIMRDATAVTPVQSGEIAAVLAKRLFTEIDRNAAAEAADEYTQMYQKNISMLPEDAVSPNFHDRMIANYPFHPTMIDFLNRKLSVAENFQGTRGVLRVLAMTVRSIWHNSTAPSVIHVSDIDMKNSAIVDELLGRTGSADLKTVLTADIGSVGSRDLSDGLSNAQMADVENPHPDGFPLYEMTWKVVFLNSLVGRSDGKSSNVFGISQQEAVFETATPSLVPSQIRTALDEISHRAFYLRYEDGKYYAHLDPTINSVLARIRGTVDQNQIDQKLVSVAGSLIRDDNMFHAELRVKLPQHIPDKKEKITVAVISPDAESVNVRDMFLLAGDNTSRIFQNSIVLLVPKTVSVTGTNYDQLSFGDTTAQDVKSRVDSIARQVIAIRKLEENPEAYGITKSKLQNDPEFRERKSERNLALETAVNEMYCDLYYADHTGIVKRQLERSSGDHGAGFLVQIKQALYDAGELVLPKEGRFGVALLRDLGKNYFFERNDYTTCAQIFDSFHKQRPWPMIPDKNTLDMLLREGITGGVWVAYKMSQSDVQDVPEELYSQKNPLPMSVDIVGGGYSIVTAVGAKNRGWLDGDRVSTDKIEESVRTVMQNSGAAYVSDVVSAVQQQYANAAEDQVKDVIKSMAKNSRYGIYSGAPDQQEKPDDLVSGLEVAYMVIKDDAVLITRPEQSQRGWNEVSGGSDNRFHKDGNDFARKLFPVLKKIGSLYTRGAKSTIDSMDIIDLELPHGGKIRVAIDSAGPDDIKTLDEFFQILGDVATVTNATDADITIEDPEENCAFIDALNK